MLNMHAWCFGDGRMHFVKTFMLFPRKLWFLGILFFGNHHVPSFSIHVNQSALTEMFIWTVGDIVCSLKASIYCTKRYQQNPRGGFSSFQDLFVNDIFHLVETEDKRLLFSGHMLLFSGHRHSYFLEIPLNWINSIF